MCAILMVMIIKTLHIVQRLLREHYVILIQVKKELIKFLLHTVAN